MLHRSVASPASEVAQLRSLSLCGAVNVDISNRSGGHVLKALFCQRVNDLVSIVGIAEFFGVGKAIHTFDFGIQHATVRMEKSMDNSLHRTGGVAPP